MLRRFGNMDRPFYSIFCIRRRSLEQIPGWEVLKSDLTWLHALEPTTAPDLSDLSDLTAVFDFWQAGNRSWRLRVKRAWKRFRFQEGMTNSLFGLHKTFFKILMHHGASFNPSPFTSLEQPLKEFAHVARFSRRSRVCHVTAG